MKFNNLKISIDLSQYNKCGTELYNCYFEGSVIYKNRSEGCKSILQLLNDLEKGEIDWNHIYGAFRVIAINKIDNVINLFSDNAGLLCFYYHENENVLSDSFINLLESTDQHNINMKAVAGIVKDTFVYSNQTICKEIKRLSSDSFYFWREEKLVSQAKLWKTFEEINYNKSVSDFSNKLLKSISGKKIASILTGGTDSRWVLSMLLSAKVDSDLFISGDEGHIDVKVAKQIAEKLNKPLTICNGTIKTQQDFDNAFEFSDGSFNCVSLYRLYVLQNTIKERGYDICLGGVGGEFYKNSFIVQKLPIYYGNLNVKSFVRRWLSIDRKSYFTDEIIGQFNLMKNDFEDDLSNIHHGVGILKQSIDYGYWILKHRMVTISNSNLVPQIAILVERDSISIPYKTNPYLLEINKIQRREVSRNSPSISKVKTDKNSSLSNSILKIFGDFFKNYTFRFKGLLKRKIKKQHNSSGLNEHVFETEIIKENYFKAFNHCKTSGIIKKDVLFNEVDRNTLDNILPVGILISKYFNKEKSSL